jgi:hypothetical protein
MKDWKQSPHCFIWSKGLQVGSLVICAIGLFSCGVEPNFVLDNEDLPNQGIQYPDRSDTAAYLTIQQGETVVIYDKTDPQSRVRERLWDLDGDGEWEEEYSGQTLIDFQPEGIGFKPIKLRVNGNADEEVIKYIYVEGAAGPKPTFEWDAALNVVVARNVMRGDSVWLEYNGKKLGTTKDFRPGRKLELRSTELEELRQAGSVNLSAFCKISEEVMDFNLSVPASMATVKKDPKPVAVVPPKPKDATPPPTPKEVRGCTDRNACNFNRKATTDSGDCKYADAKKCEVCDNGRVKLSDKDGDGICDADERKGCTDPSACNYDSRATDDGACKFADAGFDCSGKALVSNATPETAFDIRYESKDKSDYDKESFAGIVSEDLKACEQLYSTTEFVITLKPTENIRLQSIGLSKDLNSLGTDAKLRLRCVDDKAKKGVKEYVQDFALSSDAYAPVTIKLSNALKVPLRKGFVYELTIIPGEDLKLLYFDASSCSYITPHDKLEVSYRNDKCPIFNLTFLY